MSRTITRRTTVRRRRGLKGLLFLLFFLAVNAAFAYAFLRSLWHWATGAPFANGHPATLKSEFGTLVAWVIAAAITYVPVWLTRGQRERVEVEEERS